MTHVQSAAVEQFDAACLSRRQPLSVALDLTTTKLANSDTKVSLSACTAFVLCNEVESNVLQRTVQGCSVLRHNFAAASHSFQKKISRNSYNTKNDLLGMSLLVYKVINLYIG